MTTCHLHPEHDTPCFVCGVAQVRSALAVAPKTPTQTQPTTTTHERALQRARAEKGHKP